jgi:hypothetical protein
VVVVVVESVCGVVGGGIEVIAVVTARLSRLTTFGEKVEIADMTLPLAIRLPFPFLSFSRYIPSLPPTPTVTIAHQLPA